MVNKRENKTQYHAAKIGVVGSDGCGGTGSNYRSLPNTPLSSMLPS